MKPGSRVRVTTRPLTKPTARANTSDQTIPSQMLTSSRLTSSAVTSPVDAVSAPALRSNSPPISSSATATAMMPRVAVTSRTLARPAAVAN